MWSWMAVNNTYSFFCGTKLSEWIWMLIVGIIQIVVGITFVILTKKSENFQKWANKDFEKELKNRLILPKRA